MSFKLHPPAIIASLIVSLQLCLDGHAKELRAEVTLEGHTHPVICVAFSPDGKLLASASHDHTVRLWDIGFRKMKAVLKGHNAKVNSVAFGGDGKILASVSDEAIGIWDLNGSDAPRLLKCAKHRPQFIAFSPDGVTIATAGLDSTVKLWDSKSGKELFTLKGHTDGVWSVAFSPDGKILASGSDDKTIRTWVTATGKELAILKGHKQFVRGVIFSPDGKSMISGGWDSTARVWDLEASKERFILKIDDEDHSRVVWSVSISPDGTILAGTCGGLKLVQLWNFKTGAEIATLVGHESAISSVAFSSNGKILATGSSDNTIKVWSVASLREAGK